MMQTKNTFLITGGCGFIGSELIRQLLRNPRNVVVNIDKLTYAGHIENLRSVSELPNYFFIRSDICHNETVRHVFTQFRPDKVIHLAAESHVDRSIDAPIDFMQTNVIGTYSLLQASLGYWQSLSKANQKKWGFIHVSTDEVFGDLGFSSDKFNESTAYKPSSPYSASKASSDHLVTAWNRTFGLPTIITNCSNNYGPYQMPDKLIPKVIYNCVKGFEIPLYGKGQQIRDWLHVSDHAKALTQIMTVVPNGQSFCIGGDNQTTNKALVEQICHLLDEMIPQAGGSYADLIRYVKDRLGHDQCYTIDHGKLTKTIGWQPEVSFKKGLLSTIEWYLSNEDWCDAVMKKTM